MRRCDHKRTGIVSSHPLSEPVPREDAHCAVSVCDRVACMDWAMAYVGKHAPKREAVYYSDNRPGGPDDPNRPGGIPNPGTPRAERLERYRREHEETHGA
jgi:hypothetical protein